MSMTYTDAPERAVEADAPIVTPAFARVGRKPRSGVRTWMILAPIGAIVLAGSAYLMLTAPETATPLNEAPAPAIEPAPLAPMTPMEIPVPTMEAPVALEAAPASAVPVAAPTVRAPAAPAPRVETPVEPTGPRPYAAEAPAAAVPTPTQGPAIVTRPLN